MRHTTMISQHNDAFSFELCRDVCHCVWLSWTELSFHEGRVVNSCSAGTETRVTEQSRKRLKSVLLLVLTMFFLSVHLCSVTYTVLRVVVVVVVVFLSWTLRVTQYVHPHLYIYDYEYSPHRARGLRAQPFSVFLAVQAAALRLRRILSPFPGKEVSSLRSLPWLKIIPTRKDITAFLSFFTVASAF